jgi:excisionase family DNA binding protein
VCDGNGATSPEEARHLDGVPGVFSPLLSVVATRARALTAPSLERSNAQLWTVDHVAGFLGVSPKTVRKWQLNGAIPFIKLGGKLVRFDPDVIRLWVEGQTVRPLVADPGLQLVADLRRRLE